MCGGTQDSPQIIGAADCPYAATGIRIIFKVRSGFRSLIQDSPKNQRVHVMSIREFMSGI